MRVPSPIFDNHWTEDKLRLRGEYVEIMVKVLDPDSTARPFTEHTGTQ